MISSFLVADDNDDDPDDKSDDDNDDGTQPSAHHHRDLFSSESFHDFSLTAQMFFITLNF